MTLEGSLTLRAYHDSESADEVSIAFRRSATTVFVKGQPSQMEDLPIDRHAWFLNSSVLAADSSFEQHGEALCAFLTGHENELRTLRDRGWSFDIVVDWTGSGFRGPAFHSRHLRTLGELGLDLWVRLVRPNASSTTKRD